MRQGMVALALFVFLPLTAFAEIPRFAQVAPGIFRGGQPQNMKDFKELQAKGIKTLINLREEENLAKKEKQIAASLGMQSLNFPMNSLRYPKDRTVNGALDALTDPNLQPVFIHCQHGKDRTGLIIGLYRVHHEGWDRNKAFKEMLAFGFVPALVNLVYYFYDHTPGGMIFDQDIEGEDLLAQLFE